MSVTLLAKNSNGVLKRYSVVSCGWKNEEGTSDLESPIGNSWKDYWEYYTGQKWPTSCCVLGCGDKAEVGAHVVNPNIPSYDFIVPMCRGCNAKYGYDDPESMSLNSNSILVDAKI